MPRHVITVDDLSEREILAIFSLADEYLATMTRPDRPYRIRGARAEARQHQLATLFYEASTRTRFSFESAMGRLGGQVLSSADPKTTSAAKGETLADTIRVVQNYADIVVIRHPHEGAVRVAADYSEVPVINAGDGGHEHPTQTLCDLYTLQREHGTLSGLNVALWGDLKHGRTVHSLVYGLARFGARVIPMAADGFELPEHVVRRLQQDYHCTPLTPDEVEAASADDLPVHAAWVAPEKPHQRTLFADLKNESAGSLFEQLAKKRPRIDALYVTRLQRERSDTAAGTSTDNYSVVNAEFVRSHLGRHSRVMHPLPRVAELGYDIDNDERAVYFKQAAYGVPVRMALMSALLGLRPSILDPHPPARKHPVYQATNLGCANERCITTHEAEQRYLKPKFWLIRKGATLRLRCAYCEHELVPACWGRTSQRRCLPNDELTRGLPDDLIVFPDEAAAQAAGYLPT